MNTDLLHADTQQEFELLMVRQVDKNQWKSGWAGFRSLMSAKVLEIDNMLDTSLGLSHVISFIQCINVVCAY